MISFYKINHMKYVIKSELIAADFLKINVKDAVKVITLVESYVRFGV